MSTETDAFLEHRQRLTRLAYRLTGSLSDADDIVQEAWLRWRTVERDTVRDPLALLVRVTTRLALDHLRRLKRRRESYHGEWLPEPIVGRPVEDAAIAGEELSLGMLRLLETLSPLERAVFVLREAFSLSYGEIAEVLYRNEPAVRQLSRRARQHVEGRRRRYDADLESSRRMAESLVAATREGNLEALLEILAPDVVLVADGGGKVRAPLLPVHGADAVGRFLLAVAVRELPRVDVAPATVNGAPGLLVSAAGTPEAVLAFDVADDRIAAIYLVGNPDKLGAMSRHAGGVASLG